MENDLRRWMRLVEGAEITVVRQDSYKSKKSALDYDGTANGSVKFPLSLDEEASQFAMSFCTTRARLRWLIGSGCLATDFTT
jgi:hypothetical protein